MGLRGRLTALAVAVVAVALGVASVALVLTLRRSLTDDIRTGLELRAADVLTALEAGTPAEALAAGDAEDTFVQVVDDRGAVLTSSPNLDTADEAVVRLEPGEEARLDDLPFEDDEFLVVAAGEQGVTVLAGRTLEAVAESTDVVVRALLVGVPVLLALLGGAAWVLVGRVLAPVEAAHARQRRFVSDAGHELRSPIAAIRQHSEVALAHPATTSPEDLAAVTLAESLRLQEMVDGLLFLARSDERGGRLETAEAVDLDDVVFAEAARSAAGVDTSGVSGGQVHGDAAQLGRMVRNLLDNAARHARSRVAVSLAEEGGSVVLRVDDDGPGVPPGERERVFERFVRLDEARARGTGGTGLGLAIVSEVVRSHGGTVKVGESPLGGARLTVRLPVQAPFSGDSVR